MALNSNWSQSGIGKAEFEGLPVAAGQVTGISQINKFGANREIDTGTVPESVWDGTGVYPYQSTAQSLEVLGGANDVLTSGSGAWTVELMGLDANWEVQTSAPIEMAGATPVAIPGTWLRVFRAKVLTAGSNGNNDAAITFRIASAGATLALIAADLGQTTMALYTVPSGKTAYLKAFTISVLGGNAAGGQADVAIMARNNATANAAFQIKGELGAQAGIAARNFVVPLKFSEKTDIEARVLDVSANGTAVTSEFDLILIDNP